MPADIQQVTRAATGTSDWIKVDDVDGKPYFTVAVEIAGGVTANVDVEMGIGDLGGSPTVIDHSVLNALTSSQASDFFSPVTGFRLNVNSYSGSGDITLTVYQQKQ